MALVGAGNLAKWAHLPNLTKNPHASLRAVHSSAGFRGKSFAARFGAEYCCTDYEEILKDDTVDAVVIESRNQHHAAQSLAALRAGKHVFVEKPMALTEEECRELCQAVKRIRKATDGRFQSPLRAILRGAEEDTGATVGAGGGGLPHQFAGHFGVVLDGRSGDWRRHPGRSLPFMDLMYWLLGSEPISVSAYTLPTGKKDPVGENNMVAAFHFADGSVGSLNYSTIGSKTSGGERVEVFADGIGAVTEDFKYLSVRGKMRMNSTKWFGEKGLRRPVERLYRCHPWRQTSADRRGGWRSGYHRLPANVGIGAHPCAVRD